MRSEEEVRRALDAYGDMVWRVCMVHLKNRDDAQDILQNVLLKFAQHTRPFQSPEHEKAWVIRTASNACKDLLKSAHRRTTCALDECCAAAAPEQSDGSVLDAVQTLPEPYREVIYLHYYEGYSLKEIGTLLSIPAATVGTRLARGREKLKTILGGDLYENCI